MTTSRRDSISPDFVEFVPKQLEEGILYVSVAYSTTVHRCACGCGSKITLPINPAKWRFLWDGERISLWPSVGNWSYPCESHYWIEQNRIEWAPKMTRKKIEANRASDREHRERYLNFRSDPNADAKPQVATGLGLLDRLRGLIKRW